MVGLIYKEFDPFESGVSRGSGLVGIWSDEDEKSWISSMSKSIFLLYILIVVFVFVNKS